MKYPTGFAFATRDELSDIVDGLSVAMEELNYRVTELDDTGDYEPEDIVDMAEKSDRIEALFKRFVIALNGAAQGEARG
jgi:hypothetical protein